MGQRPNQQLGVGEPVLQAGLQCRKLTIHAGLVVPLAYFD
jgi:hypothetical protein